MTALTRATILSDSRLPTKWFRTILYFFAPVRFFLGILQFIVQFQDTGVIFNVLYVGIIVLSGFVFFNFLNLKKTAPALLYASLGLDLFFIVLEAVLACFVEGMFTDQTTQAILEVVIYAVLIPCNVVYFNKRKFLFVDSKEYLEALNMSEECQPDNNAINVLATKIDTGEPKLDSEPIKPAKAKKIKPDVYCKRCGGLVDKETKKCAGCGKQYFRIKKPSVKSLAVLFSVLLMLSLCANVVTTMLAVKGFNKANKTQQEYNSVVDVVSSKNQEIIRLRQEVKDQSTIAYLQGMISDLPGDEEETDIVWVSERGMRYHMNSKCSGMSDATAVTKGFAKSIGKSPCQKCCG